MLVILESQANVSLIKGLPLSHILDLESGYPDSGLVEYLYTYKSPS